MKSTPLYLLFLFGIFSLSFETRDELMHNSRTNHGNRRMLTSTQSKKTTTVDSSFIEFIASSASSSSASSTKLADIFHLSNTATTTKSISGNSQKQEDQNGERGRSIFLLCAAVMLIATMLLVFIRIGEDDTRDVFQAWSIALSPNMQFIIQLWYSILDSWWTCLVLCDWNAEFWHLLPFNKYFYYFSMCTSSFRSKQLIRRAIFTLTYHKEALLLRSCLFQSYNTPSLSISH